MEHNQPSIELLTSALPETPEPENPEIRGIAVSQNGLQLPQIPVSPIPPPDSPEVPAPQGQAPEEVTVIAPEEVSEPQGQAPEEVAAIAMETVPAPKEVAPPADESGGTACGSPPIADSMAVLAQRQEEIARELAEMSGRYQRSYAEIIVKLSAEIDKYKALDRGRMIADVIRALAKIYAEYSKSGGSCGESCDKSFLLDDIKDLLESYGAELFVSNDGDEYSRKLHKPSRDPWVVTDDESLHMRIAASVEPGVKMGFDALVQETVKLYKFGDKGEEN